MGLNFVKSGKEYKIFDGEKEVGKMYKDTKRNYQYAIVVEWNFYKELGGYGTCGKTYKAVKAEAQKNYFSNYMKQIRDKKELVED